MYNIELVEAHLFREISDEKTKLDVKRRLGKVPLREVPGMRVCFHDDLLEILSGSPAAGLICGIPEVIVEEECGEYLDTSYYNDTDAAFGKPRM